MKHDYYLHRSQGYARDYFGYIGKPYKVSWFHYMFKTIFGPLTGSPYRRTVVPAGAPMSDVVVKALENDDTHLTSHKAYKTIRDYCSEELAIIITGTDPYGRRESLCSSIGETSRLR